VASLPAIAGYELLHPLGGGPLTQVFAARRRADKFPCAIKIPRRQWSVDADAIRLLKREAEALRSVCHPHVVRMIDTHIDAEPSFLVLERLTGESLRDRLQHEGQLEQRAAFWIARQVAEGLQAMHHAGFVHADVKPDNVQIEQSGRAVLMDLGFAHFPNEVGSLEDEGFLLGTLNYVAPEMSRHSRTDEFAADWFSFGVMLHEMLTGELPHPPRKLQGFLNQTVPKSQMADRVELPSRLTELLTSLLQASAPARPRGPFVIHELIALEIAALSHRRAS
jgi:serine/threonine protein kinase